MLYGTSPCGYMCCAGLHRRDHPCAVRDWLKLEMFSTLDYNYKLCYTIVHPHIIYGIEGWGNSCRTQLATLRRLMKKCLRILTYDVFNIENIESKFLNFDHLYK